MEERDNLWMIDLPSTADPEVVRSFLSEARAIQPKDDNVREAIEYAEQLLADL
jgi:hypothetical protein